jgi:hypothetical protein
MGLSPDPVFAHNKHAARPDCELYQPGFGTSVGSPAQAVASTEDAPEEIGMCLEDAGASWTTYLRVPEIPDLGNLRLRSLRSGSVEVDAGGTQHRLSLMELRPGIGAARLAVPPTATSYKVSPKGDWPSAIAQEPWQGSARGLNPRGTLFRLRRGEWVRLKEGSAVELGEKLRVVAEFRNAPPSGCLAEAASVVAHSRVNWRMWRVVLPIASIASLERWAEDLGVVVREAAWRISLINVPQAFDDEEQIPILGTKIALIGKFERPYEGASTTAVLHAGSSSQRMGVPTSNDSAAFVAFTVPWPGRNELGSGFEEREGVMFDTAPPLTLAEVREALCKVPVLRVELGEHRMAAWHAPYDLPEAVEGQDPPHFAIGPDLEGLRLGLRWRGAPGSGREESLSVEAVEGRLRGFWGMDVEVALSGGALGSVELVFHAARKLNAAMADSRMLRWASLAAADGAGNAGAWMLRRSAELGPKVLRATQICGGNRWVPLLKRNIRKSKD